MPVTNKAANLAEETLGSAGSVARTAEKETATVAPSPGQMSQSPMLDDYLNRNPITGKKLGASFRPKTSTVSDLGHEFYINGLLSGPPTLGTNIVSNTLSTFMAPVDTFAKALIPQPGVAKEDKVRIGTAISGVAGIATGFMKSMRYGGLRAKSLIPGMSESIDETLRRINVDSGLQDVSKLEHTRRVTQASTFGFNDDSIGGKIANITGAIVNAPGTILNHTDMMNKIVLFEKTKNEWAAQQVAAGKFANMADAIAAAEDDPAVMKRAINEAEYYTLQSRPNMAFLQSITESDVSKVPGMRWVVPFRRAISNLTEQPIERSPLALAIPSLRRRLADKDPYTRITAQARVLTGTTFLVSAGLLWQNNLVGGGPTDPQERDLFEKVNGPENSFVYKDPDTGQVEWAIPLDNAGVWGQMFKVIANYNQYVASQAEHEIYADEDLTEQEKFIKDMGEFVSPIVDVLWDTTWARSLTEFASGVNEAIEKGRPEPVLRFLEKTGVNLIPVYGGSFVRYVNTVQDPIRRRNELGDYIARQSTETMKLIPKSYAWDGTEMKIGRYSTPYAWFVRNQFKPDDWLENRMVELKVSLKEPLPYITHTPQGASWDKRGIPTVKVKLTRDEWNQLNELHKTGIPGLAPPIRMVVYQVAKATTMLPRETQKSLIETAIGQFRTQAYNYMKVQPRIAQEIKKGVQHRESLYAQEMQRIAKEPAQ